MFKRVSAQREAAPAEQPVEDDVDDETLMAAFRQYLARKYGTEDLDLGAEGHDEESESEKEVYKCTLCSGRSFATEDEVEAHLQTVGHVQREIAALKRDQAKLEMTKRQLSGGRLKGQSDEKHRKRKEKKKQRQQQKQQLPQPQPQQQQIAKEEQLAQPVKPGKEKLAKKVKTDADVAAPAADGRPDPAGPAVAVAGTMEQLKSSDAKKKLKKVAGDAGQVGSSSASATTTGASAASVQPVHESIPRQDKKKPSTAEAKPSPAQQPAPVGEKVSGSKRKQRS